MISYYKIKAYRNYVRRDKILRVREVSIMETGGCGECQTSCQSACKTSCGVANQQCENSNK